MNERPIIVIDTKSKRAFYYDGFKLLAPFTEFENIQDAVKKGISFFQTLTTEKPLLQTR